MTTTETGHADALFPDDAGQMLPLRSHFRGCKCAACSPFKVQSTAPEPAPTAFAFDGHDAEHTADFYDFPVLSPTTIRVFGEGDEQMIVEIDTASGEILRDEMAPPETATAVEAERYLSPRIAYLEAKLAGLIAERDMRLARISERYDPEIGSAQSTLAWLRMGAGFREVLRAFAASALAGAKTRSLRLGDLKLGFKKQKALVQISDPEAALAWCKSWMPQAVVVKESVQISRIPEELKAGWIANTDTQYTADGFTVRPEADVFEIK